MQGVEKKTRTAGERNQILPEDLDALASSKTSN